ncbi:MAG: hypothetical protein ABJL55_01015 [Roseibium sp.]
MLKSWNLRLGAFASKPLLAAAAGVAMQFAVAGQAGAASSSACVPLGSDAELSLNDVTFLDVPPENAGDRNQRLGFAPDGVPSDARLLTIWPDGPFTQLLDIASSDAGVVAGTNRRIHIPDLLRNKDAWVVAGIRIDPGAPGLSDKMTKEFGRSPQVRLIVQPVSLQNDDPVAASTPADAKVKVHDIAVHLVFSFIAGVTFQDGEDPRMFLPSFVPDDEAFTPVVRAIADLKRDLADGQLVAETCVDTGGQLRIHPGLANLRTAEAVRARLREVLNEHLKPTQLQAMAIMGLPNSMPEPWIFLATNFSRSEGKYVPFANPNAGGGMAQMLSFLDTPQVQPIPLNDNLGPVSRNLGKPARSGVSTARLFGDNASPTEDITKVGKEIAEIVADPEKSHFFNTDCVSCHTETSRVIEKKLGASFPQIDAAVLPDSQWNVRNLGWFKTTFGPPMPTKPTITERTARETEEVAEYLNSHSPYQEVVSQAFTQ